MTADHGEEYFKQLREDGWTLTRYVRKEVQDD